MRRSVTGGRRSSWRWYWQRVQDAGSARSDSYGGRTFEWDRKTIRWRAESDKKRKEWIVPVPDALLAELRRFQRHLGGVGGWIFTAAQDSATPMSRHEFRIWLEAAEARAKLPKLDGGLWHPYRRKWATERKQLPITDVAAAGGWQDTATLIACDQQPTNDALLAVMSEERKVRDVAVVGRTREETGNETGNSRRMHRAPRIGTNGGALSCRVAPPGLEPGLS